MKDVVYEKTKRLAMTSGMPISMLKEREQELVDSGKVVRLWDYKQKMSDEEFDAYLDELMIKLEYIW